MSPVENELSEEWRPVAAFPGYSVSNLGRIRSEARSWQGNSHDGKILKSNLSAGYPACCFCVSGRVTRRAIHRIVAETFIGEIASGFEVNHKNGIRNDNRLENLEIVTRSDNLKHKFRVLGYSQFGARNPSAKLTEAEVEEIRALLAAGETQQQVIAKSFGVSNTTITGIKTGKIWSGKKWQPGPRLNFRLTEQDVRQIRSMIASGTVRQCDIAKQFGVSRTAITSIKYRKNWGHLD